MKNICYLCSVQILLRCFGSTKKLATFAPTYANRPYRLLWACGGIDTTTMGGVLERAPALALKREQPYGGFLFNVQNLTLYEQQS